MMLEYLLENSPLQKKDNQLLFDLQREQAVEREWWREKDYYKKCGPHQNGDPIAIE